MSYGGLPFFMFFDETDETIYPTNGKYKTLWPENSPLSDETKEIIKEYFCNYFTCFSRPQYWLSRFHNLLKRESDKWVKLLESEDLIKPENASENYNMVETTEFATGRENSENNKLVREATEKRTDVQTRKDTTVQTDNRENTSDNMAISYTSETPENAVTDIETYMSAAGKQTITQTDTMNDTVNTTVDVSNNDTINTTDNSTDSGTSTGTETNKGQQTITRKGNIGVTTFEKILSGYRSSVKWCTYDEVILPELEKLFIGVWSGEEEMYGYLYSTI